jgi:hypothetical protein
MKSRLRTVCLLLGAMLLLAYSPLPAAVAADSRVDVILWFDAEDYLLPADDDATKRLAEMLTERGIRATFKLVGEKARVLERRKRTDVLAALRKHAIGYHTDFHSVHPTPTEYLAECGLLDGMAEFIRREAGGAVDVRRILGVPGLACYGQPGSSWGAQAMASLGQIGIAPSGVPCYVDDGDHVGWGEQPFWYVGALTVYSMGPNVTRMELHDPAALEPAKARVAAIADRLRSQPDGGLISIYYHPCEWVHQQFWDGVNFSRGANPPREQWRPPPQRPAAETEAAFERFAAYIDHIRALPSVRFVTASELPGIYPDAVRHQGLSAEDLGQVADAVLHGATNGIDVRVLGDRALSVADQFELLSRAVGQMMGGKPVRFPLIARGLLGPDAAPPEPRALKDLSWTAFRDAARDAQGFIDRNRRVPARVFIGATAVPPADFLVALAAAYSHQAGHGQFPTNTGVLLGHGVKVLPASHIAEDTPGLFGGWIIHKEGFRAPKVLEVARLQAWTLKPAVRTLMPLAPEPGLTKPAP